MTTVADVNDVIDIHGTENSIQTVLQRQVDYHISSSCMKFEWKIENFQGLRMESKQFFFEDLMGKFILVPEMDESGKLDYIRINTTMHDLKLQEDVQYGCKITLGSMNSATRVQVQEDNVSFPTVDRESTLVVFTEKSLETINFSENNNSFEFYCEISAKMKKVSSINHEGGEASITGEPNMQTFFNLKPETPRKNRQETCFMLIAIGLLSLSTVLNLSGSLRNKRLDRAAVLNITLGDANPKLFDKLILDSVLNMYYAAETSGLHEVKVQCAQFLASHMERKDVLALFKKAVENRNFKLVEALKDFLPCGANQVLNINDWIAIAKENPELANNIVNEVSNAAKWSKETKEEVPHTSTRPRDI